MTDYFTAEKYHLIFGVFFNNLVVFDYHYLFLKFHSCHDRICECGLNDPFVLSSGNLLKADMENSSVASASSEAGSNRSQEIEELERFIDSYVLEYQVQGLLTDKPENDVETEKTLPNLQVCGGSRLYYVDYVPSEQNVSCGSISAHFYMFQFWSVCSLGNWLKSHGFIMQDTTKVERKLGKVTMDEW